MTEVFVVLAVLFGVLAIGSVITAFIIDDVAPFFGAFIFIVGGLLMAVAAVDESNYQERRGNFAPECTEVYRGKIADVVDSDRKVCILPSGKALVQ